METSTITSGVATLLDIATDCVEFITGNNLLLLFLAGGLIPIGFSIFRKAKKAARA